MNICLNTLANQGNRIMRDRMENFILTPKGVLQTVLPIST